MNETSNAPLKLTTLLKYLCGSRSAIEEIACNRSAFWLGFVFVLSAGFAREYDNEDLLHEPWYLLIPFAASVGSSLLLYFIVRKIARTRGDDKISFKLGYRSFLTLYWMTAPLAWFYAIPYEQFLPAAVSVEANLWTLGLVSTWRVYLMIRVVSVLYQSRTISSLFVVMFFADGLAMGILYFTPLPIFNIMGGTHLTESEQIIRSVAFLVGFFGWLSLPVWSLGTLIINCQKKVDESQLIPWRLQFRNVQTNGISPPLKAIATLSLLCWIPILPFTQPQQKNRRQAEKLLQSGQIKEGLEFLSSRKQKDFPRYWTPPPKLGFRNNSPPIKEVTAELLQTEQAEWVNKVYAQNVASHTQDLFQYIPLEELNQQQSDQLAHWLENHPRLIPLIDPHLMNDEELILFADWLESNPEQGKKITNLIKHEIERYMNNNTGSLSRDRAYEKIHKLIPTDN